MGSRWWRTRYLGICPVACGHLVSSRCVVFSNHHQPGASGSERQSRVSCVNEPANLTPPMDEERRCSHSIIVFQNVSRNWATGYEMECSLGRATGNTGRNKMKYMRETVPHKKGKVDGDWSKWNPKNDRHIYPTLAPCQSSSSVQT